MNNSSITSSDFFLLRTPLVPVDRLLNIFKQTRNADQRYFCKLLFELFCKKEIQEAIYLSSSAFYLEMTEWLRNNDNGLLPSDKLVQSLLKYLTRLCYRCTPFGTSAGITLGTIVLEGQTRLQLGGVGQNVQHIRIDMGLLGKLMGSIMKEAKVIRISRFFANDSIYQIGDELRYINYKMDGRIRVYELASIGYSEIICKAIEASKSGINFEDLVAFFIEGNGTVTVEEVEEFIHQLIDSRLLLNELELTITGTDPLTKSLALINRYGIETSDVLILKSLEETFKKISTKEITFDVKELNQLAQKVNHPELEGIGSNYFQVDLLKPAKTAEISARAINRFCENISKLKPYLKQESPTQLDDFKQHFYNRYQDREIMLLEALDQECGIGYPVNKQADFPYLLEGITVGVDATPSNVSKEIKPLYKLLLSQLLNPDSNGSTQIHLSDKDIVSLNGPHEEEYLPNSLFAFGSVHGDQMSPDHLNLYLKFISGPSASRLLGRFCYADKKLCQKVRNELEREEQSSNALYAEIVHLPEDRLGNIILRPVLRQYEVTIMTRSGVDSENTIPLNDLYISIKANNLVLRSKTLNKRIIPRLSSAHNFGLNPLPPYQFLCDLQNQNYSPLFFSWPSLFQEFRFLPRICYQNLILSKARWKLDRGDLEKLLESEDSVALENLRILREKFKIPKLVEVAEGDNALLIDLENIWSCRLLTQLQKSSDHLSLDESLINDSQLLVTDNEGNSYTNEVIIPLTNTPNLIRDHYADESNHPDQTDLVRSYPVGSEWLYLKIYCGFKSADRLLVEYIFPIVNSLLKLKLIDKWFFIRFSDTIGSHLRIRFHGNHDFYKQVIDIINKSFAPLLTSKFITNFIYDTYDREIERYEPNNIENTETLFYLDSHCSLQLLSLLDLGESGDYLRWLSAARNVDMILKDWGLDPQEKRNLLKRMSDSFTAEFNVINNKNYREAISRKFRKDKTDLNIILADNNDSKFDHLISVFYDRSFLWKDTIDIVKETLNYDKWINILPSYIHMSLNKLFQKDSRAQELVIYDYLFRVYESAVKRNAYEKSDK